jgi:hypothetical protein
MTLSIISLIRIFVLPPPFNDGMRCIAHDFHGGFVNNSLNDKDEERKDVYNLRWYYSGYY